MNWYQPKSPSQSSWEEGSGRYYIIGSILFWWALSGLGFAFLADFRVTETLVVQPFGSWATTREALWIGALLVLFSTFGGLIASIPALLVRKITGRQIEILQKRSWNAPVFRMQILKVIPFVALIISNFLVLSLSLGAAPQFSRNMSHRPSFLSSWSRLVYDTVHLRMRSRNYGKDWEQIASQGKTKSVIFLLPSSVMQTPNLLAQTTKELAGDSVPYFIDAPTLASSFVQKFSGSPGFKERYFAPLTSSATLVDVEERVTGSHEDFLLSPISSWLAAKNEAFQAILEETPVKEGAESVRGRTSSMLAKRLALSQPHLYFFFSTNLGNVFESRWRWRELINDDSVTLEAVTKNLLKDESNSRIKLIQFSELERVSKAVWHPNGGMRWPEINGLTERQRVYAAFDGFLAQAVRALKKSNRVSIYLLPYLDEVEPIRLNTAFIHIASESEASSDFAEWKSQNRWANARLIYRMLDMENKGEVVGSEGQNKSDCEPIFYSFENLNKTSSMPNSNVEEDLWKFVSLSGDHRFLDVTSNLKFLYRKSFEYGVSCYFNETTNLSSQEPSQDNLKEYVPLNSRLWLIQTERSEKDLVDGVKEGDALSALFSAPRVVRIVKIQREPKRPQRPATNRRQESEEKIPEFTLYGVRESSSHDAAVNAAQKKFEVMPEEVRKQFWKTFKDRVEPEFSQVSRGRMLWD